MKKHFPNPRAQARRLQNWSGAISQFSLNLVVGLLGAFIASETIGPETAASLFVGVFLTASVNFIIAVKNIDGLLADGARSSLLVSGLVRRGLSPGDATALAKVAEPYLRGTKATIDDTIDAFAEVANGGQAEWYFKQFDEELRDTGLLE